MMILEKSIINFSVIIFICLFIPYTQAQDKFGIGVNLGGGFIGGNLPSQGSFSTAVFVEGNPGFNGNYLMRLTFVYVTDVNVMMPTLEDRYSPFLKGVSLKGIQSQDYASSLYSEEGLGLLALNDRTFSSVDEWDYGAAFSLLVGADLRHGRSKGFKVGIGGEYGLTFTNTTVRYLSVYLQTELFF
ncbi:MAG: hypothetical protein P4L45_16615 [Ignavibacteriaceae bacterium]|nr:hypothetical protein [Ignavibacteriaceae bacterium]